MVIRTFGIYKMWYAGRSAGGQYAIGYAVDEGATAVTLSSFDARADATPNFTFLALASGVGCLGLGYARARRWRRKN